MLHQPDPCFLYLKKHGMLHKSYIKLTYYCQHKVLLFLNEPVTFKCSICEVALCKPTYNCNCWNDERQN